MCRWSEILYACGHIRRIERIGRCHPRATCAIDTQNPRQIIITQMLDYYCDECSYPSPPSSEDGRWSIFTFFVSAEKSTHVDRLLIVVHDNEVRIGTIDDEDVL
jgi:hypothetical protein